MTTPTTQREADELAQDIDLSKLAAIADRVRARGLFNASYDILDWIQEVRTTLARRAPATATNQPSAGSGQKSTKAES